MQAKMDNNKRQSARYKAKANYLLTGLIYCAKCGSALVGDSSSYQTKSGLVRNNYYQCNNKDRQETCDNPKTRKRLVDLVLDKMLEKIFNRDKLSEICTEINNFNRSQSSEISGELAHYQSELSETNKQLDNLVMAIANGAPFKSLTEKIKDLEIKKSQLEARIKETQIYAQRALITEDMISHYLDQHRQAVAERDIDACKKFIHNYVEKVIVDKDDITIKIHFQYCGYGGGGGAYCFKTKTYLPPIKRKPKTTID